MGIGKKNNAFAGRLSLAKLVIKRIRAQNITNNRVIEKRHNAMIASGLYATPLVHKDIAVKQYRMRVMLLCAQIGELSGHITRICASLRNPDTLLVLS